MELRSELEQQSGWRAGLDSLPTSTHIGFLHIDAAPLKESLMPVTERAIEQVLAKCSRCTLHKPSTSLSFFCHYAKNGCPRAGNSNNEVLHMYMVLAAVVSTGPGSDTRKTMLSLYLLKMTHICTLKWPVSCR